MKELLRLIATYGNILFFLLLELICFYFIINYNRSQQDIWVHSINTLSGNILQQRNKLSNYIQLEQENDSLLIENAQLLEEIINYRIFDNEGSFQSYESSDTTYGYQYIPSRICNKTIHLKNNHITLCQGINAGLEKDMGVINKKSIVGVITSVTDDYAKVMLLQHSQSRISTLIKSKGYSGNLIWEGRDPRVFIMDAIPKYADISIGDTIVTSGYSTVFPPNLPLGKIISFDTKADSDSYIIKVSLFDDVADDQYVYAIKNDHKIRIDSLENIINE